MVVIFLPSPRKAGTRQEWNGLPSTHTVQAPQSPASQPFLTPNTSRSRRKVRRHWPGFGSAEYRRPLTSYLLMTAPRESVQPDSG